MPDSKSPNSEPGELMNVREVHGAIMREFSLPGEKKLRVPWYLRILYHALGLWAYAYLASYSGNFAWNEYEQRAGVRAKRELLERQAEAKRSKAAPESTPAPTPPKP
jgi:hypothetical protein